MTDPLDPSYLAKLALQHQQHEATLSMAELELRRHESTISNAITTLCDAAGIPSDGDQRRYALRLLAFYLKLVQEAPETSEVEPALISTTATEPERLRGIEAYQTTGGETRYRYRVRLRGQRHNLGTFTTVAEANAAKLAADQVIALLSTEPLPAEQPVDDLVESDPKPSTQPDQPASYPPYLDEAKGAWVSADGGSHATYDAALAV